MGGKSSTQTTTSEQEPPSFQKPYIVRNMSRAEDLYNKPGPSYYPNSTVAGFHPMQEQAFNMGENRAVNGNTGMKAAQGFNTDVINGKHNGDPYGGQVFRNISSKVTPQVNAQFSSAGRYGSGAHADTMTRALTESFAPYAAQQHQQGQDRQMQASGMAQGFAANEYADIAALGDIGGQRQQLAQGEIDDAKARWDYRQDLPYNKLAQLQGLVGGSYGGQTTSSVPYNKPSPWSKIAGAGLGLAGLFG